MLDNQQVIQDDATYIAALDLGSNSFHMAIARESHGELRIIETLGEKVQLASGIDDDGVLSEEAQERALACLHRFSQRIRDFESCDVQIVGTNSLRVAKNRMDFIHKAEPVIGFPIDIISGREEARLIYLGVAHTAPSDKSKRLVVDIGGGSTEFMIGEGFEVKQLESLHMGCVSYRERYIQANHITRLNFDRAVSHAARELMPIRRAYLDEGWEIGLGSSGTIKAIANSLAHLGLTENGLITFEALDALKEKLIELGSLEGEADLGVKADRLSIFPSGLAILYAVFQELQPESMAHSTGALREGLLYDIVGRTEHEDVRIRTIRSIQQRYHIDVAQGARVSETVMHAYEQVAKTWGLRNTRYANLLRWASNIYEIGLTIAHTQYHKHGAYVVKHSDLPGFTQRTKYILSALVRLHRRKFAMDVLEEFDEPEKTNIMRLAVLFRLAVVFTAMRYHAETDFSLLVSSTDENHLVLTMGQGWLENHPLTHANLESEADLLEHVGVRLTIQ